MTFRWIPAWAAWAALWLLPIISPGLCLASGLDESAYATAAEAVLTEPPPIDYHIIDQGGPRTVVTNWAYFGSLYGQLVDSSTGETAIPLEYPGGSRIMYLYDAGLWIGGIVNGDTLVSTASYSSWVRRELHPDTGAAGQLVFDDYLADEVHTAAYADTFTEAGVTIPDRYDGPHRPLNIAVRQECRAWADPAYRDMVWTKLVITNIGERTIEDAWVGWHTDPDIHHLDIRGGYADDLTGYRQGIATFAGQSYPFEAAYAIDNDGDPDSLTGFTDSSSTGALGLAFISGSPPPAERSYNWWVNSYSLGLDWGPHRIPAEPGVPELFGRPVGDAARYRMLSNVEIDYDQVYAALDKTAEGWAPSPDTTFFAAGYDIRFVYSVGAYTLLPGDSIIVNFIWFAGPGIHTDPTHFADSYSFDDPDIFLSGLDFEAWETTIGAALALEASGFVDAAPGPPYDVWLDSWTTDRITLGWRPKQTFDLAGYEIFRREIDGEYSDLPLAVVLAGDATYTDPGLALGEYAYAIRSFDADGRRGPPSDDILVNLRMPMAVTLHEVIAADGDLLISWDSPVYTDIAGYHIDRSWETAPGETTATVIGWTTDVSFLDVDPQEAVKYHYAVTAESGSGFLGMPSNRVPGILLAFDGGPLVIDQTLADAGGLTDKDSVRAFWERTLPDAVYRDEDRALPATMTLFDLNAHPVTIVVSSGNFSETQAIHDLLQDYFIAGGKVLLVGRDLFNLDDLAFGNRYFGPGDFAYEYFGVTRIYYPASMLSHPTQMNAEFVGARSCHADFPDVPVDSARTDWGIPVQLQPAGPGVSFVGWLEGDPEVTDCLYTYESSSPDSSAAQGKTVGLLYSQGRRRAGILNFPLSMMEETNAATALHALLAKLGQPPAVQPGDFDGDGRVGILDVVMLISWVFRDGPPPTDRRAADVNGDCVVNLVDVVIMVNYLYRGGAPPRMGCNE